MVYRVSTFIFTLSFALITQSCGKKIEDSSSGERKPGSQNEYITVEDITLEASVDQDINRIIASSSIPRHGSMKIPESIKVIEGNAGNYWARLTINKDIEGFEFYCLYQGGAKLARPDEIVHAEDFKKGLTYHFKGCFNEDNQEFMVEDLELFTTPIYQNKNIELRLLGAHPDHFTKAITNLLVTWD